MSNCVVAASHSAVVVVVAADFSLWLAATRGHHSRHSIRRISILVTNGRCWTWNATILTMTTSSEQLASGDDCGGCDNGEA